CDECEPNRRLGGLSRWCNGKHRALLKLGSRFKSGPGYCPSSECGGSTRPCEGRGPGSTPGGETDGESFRREPPASAQPRARRRLAAKRRRFASYQLPVRSTWSPLVRFQTDTLLFGGVGTLPNPSLAFVLTRLPVRSTSTVNRYQHSAPTLVGLFSLKE